MKNICFRTIMLKGEAGGTIDRIEKTSSSFNVDTYTIYLNDGTTSTFEVTNGTSIESIEKTATAGYIDTYTITLTDGSTQTFEVENGKDGAPGYEVPAGAVVYFDSSDAIPEGYEASANPDASAISSLQSNIGTLQDREAFIGLHDTGSTAVATSGVLSSVGAWILANYVSNKVIHARIAPTDSTGYFGSNAFTVIAESSDGANGWAILQGNITGKAHIIFGKAVSSTWYWYEPSLSAIS